MQLSEDDNTIRLGRKYLNKYCSSTDWPAFREKIDKQAGKGGFTLGIKFLDRGVTMRDSLLPQISELVAKRVAPFAEKMGKEAKKYGKPWVVERCLKLPEHLEHAIFEL